MGFFGGTRTADVAVWDQAYTEWVQAENLPDAEAAAAAAAGAHSSAASSCSAGK